MAATDLVLTVRPLAEVPQHVEAAAAEAGYARRYLHTSTAARLYAHLGWRRYEETRESGARVLIMSRRIPAAEP